MRTSENFSIHTSKIFSPNKGFAPILIIGLIFVLIATGVIGYTFFYLQKNSKSNNSSGTPSKPLFISETNQDNQQQGILQQLLNKMKSYKNYQLDITIIGASVKAKNYKILRFSEKQFQEFNPIITTYIDNNLGKSFTYYKDKNEYGEGKSTDLEFSVGTPEYYFKNWTIDVKIKGDDVIDGQKVTVYENINNGTSITAYISTDTGLPVKTIQKITNGEIIATFKFSRINEIQESEVTIPSSAKKIVNL